MVLGVVNRALQTRTAATGGPAVLPCTSVPVDG